MARKRTNRRAARSRERNRNRDADSLRFSRKNGILGLAGLLVIVLGYALLAQGSITAAPLLLVLGYLVLLPLALVL
ncbi:MAG: DUF3098 domain-containing protein [Gammaproteobacteria bacterium]|nr:hypothetical protein [Gammaproteobacteria bacterium]MXY30389.1 DUF3098 domain-containing protein [Gammaproteobacteria bacterium]MYC98948.1 DUF3098 domain-containing protein [Gammaproteobacteria bacterium]MYF62665.1 DUF3098 domain-containing protein [Gammaproteobacteria bacterium]MYI23533.1 DUF3098 domain-containing protein [Gammaproteobacteria bacterium]